MIYDKVFDMAHGHSFQKGSPIYIGMGGVTTEPIEPIFAKRKLQRNTHENCYNINNTHNRY